MRKNLHVYGWDSEPSDERPSEFMPSTGYSVLSGYSTLDYAVRARRRKRNRFGALQLLIVVAVILGLGAYAIYRFARLMHG